MVTGEYATAAPATELVQTLLQADDSSKRPYIQRVPQGTVVLQQGDAASQVYIIQSGRVELRRTVAGAERLLAVLGPGDVLGAAALLTGAAQEASAAAVTEAQLVVVDAARLDSMLRRSPYVAAGLLKQLARQLCTAREHVDVLAQRDLRLRVARGLLQQSRECGEVTPEGLLVPLADGQLAARCALHGPEVDRQLAALERARVVVQLPDALLLPRLDKLEQFIELMELRYARSREQRNAAAPPERSRWYRGGWLRRIRQRKHAPSGVEAALLLGEDRGDGSQPHR